MAYPPYDPFRGRTSRSRQQAQQPRRVPLSVLIAVVVLPVLVVSTFLFWQTRGGDDPVGTSSAAASTADPRGETAAPSESASGTAAVLGAAEAPSPEATEANAAPPTSLGIPAPELSAASAIVVDDASMEVLYALDAYSPRPPASVTKMATAVVALERGRLDDVVKSTVHYWDLAYEADSTTMGLIPGDEVTLRELIYGLLLVSGNDAAEMIANHISGSKEAFAAEMNALAERLGMDDTHFVTVDGLSAEGHVSSPWDLVLLSRYLMRFPDLREIVGTEEYTARGIRDGEEASYDLYNHNPLLNYTPGVDGIKTGYTEEAGRTYSVTVERDGHRVFIVLMDSVLRAQDAQAIIEWTYENHIWPGDTAPPSGEQTSTAP